MAVGGAFKALDESPIVFDFDRARLEACEIMMPAILQRQDQDETIDPSSQEPEDYYSALVSLIAEAASDPARVRKLVYAVVRSNLNPETVFSPALTDATWHA